MQFLSDLKKAAKGERQEEFSFDDDTEKSSSDKWLEKISNVSKKIQSAPAAAKERMQKMREPKDEAKAAYFEEAAQDTAKSATWWSGCDPKDDPDVNKNWSRSASSETIQSHAGADSISSGDESWHEEEEDEDEDDDPDDLKGPVRMSQIDYNSLQNGGLVTLKAQPQPMESIAEAKEEKPEQASSSADPPKASASEPAKAEPAPKVEVPAKDPFDSSGDEAPAPAPAAAPAAAAAAAAPAPVEEPAPKPKKAKKPVKPKPAPEPVPAKDPFADSDSDGGAPAPAKTPAPAADPFADSDSETGPLLPSQPSEAKPKRASQIPTESESKSLSSSGPEVPKKVKKPKARPGEAKKEDGTGSKKPAGKPKKKAPVVAAQDSDGEDAKF